MKKEFWIGLVAGFLIAILLIGVAGYMAAPSVMIQEDLSQLGFEETVQAIQDSAAGQDWKVPTVHHIDSSVESAGYDVLPVAAIKLCQPDHAGRILEEDEAKIVTSMMPCRVSVYETGDGDVVISRMNSGLISKIFGGTVAEVMTQASAENEVILAPLFQ